MTLQDFFSQWWVGGIVLPVIFTVGIGGIVNLWSGFVTADLVEFRRTVREAFYWMEGVVEGPTNVLGDYAKLRHTSKLLADLGQVKRADEVNALALKFAQIRVTASQLRRDLYEIPSPDYLAERAKLDALIDTVRTMQPDYRELFLHRFDLIWNHRSASGREHEI